MSFLTVFCLCCRLRRRQLRANPRSNKDYRILLDNDSLSSLGDETTVEPDEVVSLNYEAVMPGKPRASLTVSFESIDIKGIIPSQPGKPMGSSLNHNSIQLEWTKPEQGAHNVIAYHIFHRSDKDPPGKWMEYEAKSTEEEATVSQLSEGTIYTFKIQPECADGFGPESDVSEPISTDIMFPGKPGKPKASNITHDSIDLEWTKPEQGAHNIASYTVFYRSTDDPPDTWREQKTKEAEERATITQLCEKDTYLFKVRPECREVDVTDSMSSVSESIQTKMIIPSEPGKPQASCVTNSSIQLEWAKPEQGAHNIIAYHILYRSHNNPPDEFSEYKAKGDEEKVTISQLSEETIYYFKIRPECQDGFGLESEISEPIATKMTTPSKPGKPTGSDITHDSVQLKWSKPEQGACDISYYKVFYRSSNNPPDMWSEQLTSTAEESVTVSQLLEKSIYFFKVRPESRSGKSGLESDESEPIQTAMIIPSKPGKPKPASLTHDSIELEWTKPDQGAHNVTSYIIYGSKTDAPYHWIEQNAVKVETNDMMLERVRVTKLLEKTMYYFKIRPVCMAGNVLESDISEPIKTKGIIPSQPGKPMGSSLNHNSIQLEWTKPEQGAHAVIAYHIFHHSDKDPPGKWMEYEAKSTEEEATVSQLSEGTIYTFKIQPECADGFGPESDVSEPVSTKMEVPSKPGKPKASNITHDSVELEWTKPVEGAHNVASCFISCRSISDPSNHWNTNAEIISNRIIVPKLLENTSYQFKVCLNCVDGSVVQGDDSGPIKTREALTLRNILPKLLEAREKWYNIGLVLGLEEYKLDAIRHDNNDKWEPCLKEMISLWLRQVGPSWERLIDALRDDTVGFCRLADSIDSNLYVAIDSVEADNEESQGDMPSGGGFKCPCEKCSIDQYFKGECPKFQLSPDSGFPYLRTNNLSKNEMLRVYSHLLNQTKEIAAEFSKFISQVRHSFNQQDIKPEELAASTIDIAPCESLTSPLLGSVDVQKLKTVTAVISGLQQRKYISFFNYHIVKHLVNEFGKEEDKASLSAYEKKFNEYCKRSVFEVPQAVFGSPPDDGKMLAFKVTENAIKSFPISSSPVSSLDLHTSVIKSARTLHLSLSDTLSIQTKIAESFSVLIRDALS